MKFNLATALRYLLQGVVIILPFAITFALVYYVFDFVDTIIPIRNMPRGLGFVIVIAGLILIGYLGSRFFLGRLVLDIFDRILEKIPGLKIIYTAVKDFAEGFVGDKRKFKTPVLIKINEHPEMHRVGFLTQENLTKIGLVDKVMVYVPHSYNFSGNLFVVQSTSIQLLDMDAGDAMKLAVSGGVAGFDEEEISVENFPENEVNV